MNSKLFELTEELRLKIRANKAFFEAFYNTAFATTEYVVIKKSVAGNTFRSSGFDAGDYVRSSIFRVWAQDHFFATFLGEVGAVECEEQYHSIHVRMVKDFELFWINKTDKTISIAYCRKLVDLLMKMVVNYKALNETDRLNILKFIYVPLDKYSLRAIREIWNIKAKRTDFIPANASMSFMKDNHELYYKIQECISQAIGPGNCRIEFDVLVWNNPTYEPLNFRILEKTKKKNEKSIP